MVQMIQEGVPTARRHAGGESFEAFYRREQTRLLRALYVMTGDRYLAEELMQDAFASIWERWERVSALENPTGYLYKTALNRLRRHYRRLTRAVAVAFRITPRDQLYQVEERDAVVRALATLTPRQRAALVLTEMLEFDSEAAGRLLGVRPVTVRRLASTGRQRLRAGLEENP